MLQSGCAIDTEKPLSISVLGIWDGLFGICFHAGEDYDDDALWIHLFCKYPGYCTPLNADVLQVRPLPSDKTAGAPHGEDRRQEGGGRNGWSGLSQAEENVSFDHRQAFQIQGIKECCLYIR